MPSVARQRVEDLRAEHRAVVVDEREHDRLAAEVLAERDRRALPRRGTRVERQLLDRGSDRSRSRAAAAAWPTPAHPVRGDSRRSARRSSARTAAPRTSHQHRRSTMPRSQAFISLPLSCVRAARRQALCNDVASSPRRSESGRSRRSCRPSCSCSRNARLRARAGPPRSCSRVDLQPRLGRQRASLLPDGERILSLVLAGLRRRRGPTAATRRRERRCASAASPAPKPKMARMLTSLSSW